MTPNSTATFTTDRAPTQFPLHTTPSHPAHFYISLLWSIYHNFSPSNSVWKRLGRALSPFQQKYSIFLKVVRALNGFWHKPNLFKATDSCYYDQLNHQNHSALRFKLILLLWFQCDKELNFVELLWVILMVPCSGFNLEKHSIDIIMHRYVALMAFHCVFWSWEKIFKNFAFSSRKIHFASNLILHRKSFWENLKSRIYKHSVDSEC